jgi:hypothetical protein
MFPVRYKLTFCVLFRRSLVFEALMAITVLGEE